MNSAAPTTLQLHQRASLAGDIAEWLAHHREHVPRPAGPDAAGPNREYGLAVWLANELMLALASGRLDDALADCLNERFRRTGDAYWCDAGRLRSAHCNLLSRGAYPTAREFLETLKREGKLR